MVSVSLGFLPIIISLVLTVEMVEMAIPPGTQKADVESYFSEIGAVSAWYSRNVGAPETSNFPWLEDEVGVISSGAIRNVKEHWWWPSFGKIMIVHVGISANGRVTQLQFEQHLSGWP